MLLILCNDFFSGRGRSEWSKGFDGSVAAGDHLMFVVLVMMMLMPLQLQKQEDPYPQALEKIAAQVTNPLTRPACFARVQGCRGSRLLAAVR